jgi:hypothetical protein
MVKQKTYNQIKRKLKKTNKKGKGGKRRKTTRRRKTPKDEIGNELYMAALVAAAVNLGDSTDTSDTSDTLDIN